MRLDRFLTINKYAESRNKALMLIRDGHIFVNDICITKPSFDIKDCDLIDVKNITHQYVARSAQKLLTAKDVFGIDFKNKVAVDLGASTGGFCEVMLENNIRQIYAVDIGTNQLHPRIKSDRRVINMENTNARYLSKKDFSKKIDIVTCDLSFISLKYIFNAVYCILEDDGEFVCLVKPQFEAGREFIGKNGVVKDKSVHFKVVSDISNCAAKIGFNVIDICFSGVEGESGNKEYLMYMKKDGSPCALTEEYILKQIVGE